MTLEVALGLSATVLSVVAIVLSLVFFFKTNDLFGKMNTTEARIEEIARGTSEKMSAVVDRAVDFWTRPTKEDQAAWESAVRELREQLVSLFKGKLETYALLKGFSEVLGRMLDLELEKAKTYAPLRLPPAPRLTPPTLP